MAFDQAKVDALVAALDGDAQVTPEQKAQIKEVLSATALLGVQLSRVERVVEIQISAISEVETTLSQSEQDVGSFLAASGSSLKFDSAGTKAARAKLASDVAAAQQGQQIIKAVIEFGATFAPLVFA